MSETLETPLKRAIRESGYRQNFISGEVGISEHYLSHLASGRRHPSDDLKRKLARILQRTGAELGWPEIDQPADDVSVAA